MDTLYDRLAERVDAWRAGGYPSELYPAIAEMLEWSRDPDEHQLRFLRAPQLRALETYWYLRLVEQTPHILALYQRLFPKPSELRRALGLDHNAVRDLIDDNGLDAVLERIRTDDAFVGDFKLESLRETLTLDYPSWILALAMGAGKTILIGAIIATEFAMAMEYPDGPFVQNALVFAPGKTIIESLRELVEVPYDRILPPRMHKSFAASVKLTFTRDGEKDLPVVRGSLYNVVVTNTEKIRIQRESVRRSDIGRLFDPRREEEARAEVANLRLTAIASLPSLAVFSDEAHHTYGQSLGNELKKVRKTVDYLAAQTNLLVVVNTTGTPYFQRQPLRDVVIWYGLAEGIRDGILKEVAGNIQAFDFDGDARHYIRHVVRDFFTEYGEIRLPNGAPAKLALYFPQTNDLRELRPVVDEALASVGLTPALCLVNTSDASLTSADDIEAFRRLNDPRAPHRVILLVNKGTEGWNCPSLFACALARKLRSSNNFVLQAATRCLRQVPGNERPARIYLSRDNQAVLDRQLQETYGQGIAELNHAGQETRRVRIRLRKLHVPPLWVTRTVRRVTSAPPSDNHPPLLLERPMADRRPTLTRATLTVAEQAATSSVLRQVGETVVIEAGAATLDAYAVAIELAGRYRIEIWTVYDELRRVYGEADVPEGHLDPLARQIEAWQGAYTVVEEREEVALALVKPEGFTREVDTDGTEAYVAEIVYPRDRERLLLEFAKLADRNAAGFGFHYDPYDFDSTPEESLYEQLLQALNLRPDEIEDCYFTGALTDPAKTDFFVEYRDEKGKWRRYTPDFVVRKKPPLGGKPGSGRVLIIEVKRADYEEAIRKALESGQATTDDGRKALAVRRWEQLDPERLRYELVYAKDVVANDDVLKALRALEGHS